MILESPELNKELNKELNDYKITFIEKEENKTEEKFGLYLKFERKPSGINGILIKYHMMCAMLVFVGLINFLIDPDVVPGRAGLLVTMYLILTSFFCNSQVGIFIFHFFEK